MAHTCYKKLSNYSVLQAERAEADLFLPGTSELFIIGWLVLKGFNLGISRSVSVVH